MRTLVRGLLTLAALLALLALAGCGTDGSVSAEATRRSPSPSPASSFDPAAPAARWLLPDDALPAGWRRATGQQQLGVPVMCDLTLEPPVLADAATRRYARAYEGPFVVQYSFVSADPGATQRLMADWARAATTCRAFAADGVTLDVTPLTDVTPVGEDFGAVHASAPGGQQRDYVAFRAGGQVTVLISAGIGELASHQDLSAFARAVAAR